MTNPTGEAVRRRVVVHGEVQGVFFRDTVASEAREAGVAGWVRNCADGTVEAVLEGEPEAVDRVVNVCREGPDRAQVSHVDVEDGDPQGASGFDVR